MFTPHMTHWNDMMDKVREMYNTSLKTNQQVQNEFNSLLKEIIQQTVKNTVGFQKETENITQKLTQTYFDNVNKITNFQVENSEKTYQTIMGLMDTYGIHNKEFRGEIEKIWKTNTTTYRGKVEEMNTILRANQEKYLQTVFETWRNSVKEMEQIHNRVDTASNPK